jgi:hypothetical protein
MGAVCALNGLLGGVYADMGLTGAPVPPAPPDAYLHGAANIGAHKGQVAEGRRTLPKVRLLQARNGKHVQIVHKPAVPQHVWLVVVC